jgi:hypothetical protein
MLSAVHPCINLVLITIFKMCCYVSDIIINTYNSCDDDDDGCRYNTNYRTIRSRIARWCLDNLKLWRPSKSSMMRWWWYWWWWFLTLRCAVTASDIIIMISWFADICFVFIETTRYMKSMGFIHFDSSGTSVITRCLEHIVTVNSDQPW